MVDFITPEQILPIPVTRYKWQNHSTHPCKECADLNGQVRTQYEWNLVHQHKHCHCSLEPVADAEDGICFNASVNGAEFVSNSDASLSTIIKNPGAMVLHPDLPRAI